MSTEIIYTESTKMFYLKMTCAHCFSARYAQYGLNDVEMKKIVNKLVVIQSTLLYLGNQEAFWLVNKGYDLVRDDVRKVALHVDYIDFDNPENNIFKVVNQYIPRSIFFGHCS